MLDPFQTISDAHKTIDLLGGVGIIQRLIDSNRTAFEITNPLDELRNDAVHETILAQSEVLRHPRLFDMEYERIFRSSIATDFLLATSLTRHHTAWIKTDSKTTRLLEYRLLKKKIDEQKHADYLFAFCKSAPDWSLEQVLLMMFYNQIPFITNSRGKRIIPAILGDNYRVRYMADLVIIKRLPSPSVGKKSPNLYYWLNIPLEKIVFCKWLGECGFLKQADELGIDTRFCDLVKSVNEQTPGIILLPDHGVTSPASEAVPQITKTEEQAATRNVNGVLIPVAPGTKWEDVTITLSSAEMVEVCVGEQRKKYTYHQLGFQDRRRGDWLNKLWLFFLVLLKDVGYIKPRNGNFHGNLPDTASRFASHLKTIFGIQDKVFPHYKAAHGYQARFKAQDCTQGSFKQLLFNLGISRSEQNTSVDEAD